MAMLFLPRSGSGMSVQATSMPGIWFGGEITPDPGNADVYRRQYAIFRELYPRIRDLMQRLDG